jgi:acetoacetyl-CoA reductase/3-oxoacyl-[acyl-carrier protein] reductase
MGTIDLTQNDNVSTRIGDKLKGRVAYVTGGTRGIGASICRSLASQGAVLAAGYTGNDKAAGEFRDTFTSTYATPVSIHKGNLGEPDDCRRTIDEVITTHGRLDILVNNAGITIDKTVLKMSDADWFNVLNVNLNGVFFLSQAALRHMAERGSGRIVNVSSVIGEMGNIGQANYAASKSGLFGLTKTLAREAAYLLGRSGKLTEPNSIGITINTITPGFIATEMLEHIPEKVMEKILSQIPLGRLGKVEEVARVVHFLAADASSYITGQVWGVNGGMDM